MNYINTETGLVFDIDAATKRRDELKEELNGLVIATRASARQIAEKWLARSGVTGYKFLAHYSFDYFSFDYFELRNEMSEERFRIDVTFRYHDWEGGRTLQLNPCSVGNVKSNDFGKIAFFNLCAFLATHAGEIEAELLAVPTLVATDRTQKELGRIHSAINKTVEAERREAKERKMREVVAGITKGAIIVSGRGGIYNPTTGGYDKGRLIYTRIVSDTAKMATDQIGIRCKKESRAQAIIDGHHHFATPEELAEISTYK